jgi:hypothetical protein
MLLASAVSLALMFQSGSGLAYGEALARADRYKDDPKAQEDGATTGGHEDSALVGSQDGARRTFFATMLHLTRNGTFTRSEKVRARAEKLLPWVPLATILAYALIILLAQLQGLDFLGEMAKLIF